MQSRGHTMKRFAGVTVAAIAACATPASSPDFERDAWRAPGAAAPAYLLAPGDRVEVTVFSAPELSRTVDVGPDGRIRLPLAGDVFAAGRTVDEVRAGLVSALSDELLEPDLDVAAIGFGSQQVFVGGEVRSPGAYPLPGQIDPLQAVILAGGFTENAWTRQVVLMRRVAGGEVKSQVVNLRGGVFDATLADWGPIRRFDVIYVPRSRIAEQNLFVQQYIRNSLPVDFSLFFDVTSF